MLIKNKVFEDFLKSYKEGKKYENDNLEKKIKNIFDYIENHNKIKNNYLLNKIDNEEEKKEIEKFLNDFKKLRIKNKMKEKYENIKNDKKYKKTIKDNYNNYYKNNKLKILEEQKKIREKKLNIKYENFINNLMN